MNGVITVLKSVPFTATPGAFHTFRFSVLGNELHAYVDDVFKAGAIDDGIPRGRYGVGSYRAAFTYQTFIVKQP